MTASLRASATLALVAPLRLAKRMPHAFNVDKEGRTIDFLLTHRRNSKAARRFLAKALRTRQNWPSHVINTDKNPA